MKKVWLIVLLGILLLLIACTKEQVAETDLIFEGKTYVVGSGKPPKGQPKKMLIQKRFDLQGNNVYRTVDSFYTDNAGYFSYRFKPHSKPTEYAVLPEPLLGYDNIDRLFPQKSGLHKKDFRVIGNGLLRLRIINANYHLGDSLVVIGPSNTTSIFAGPLAYDIEIEYAFQSFEEKNVRV